MRIDEKYKRLIKCFFSVVMILLLTVTYHQFWVRYYNKIILYPFYRRGMWMMAGIYAAMLIFFMNARQSSFSISWKNSSADVLSFMSRNAVSSPASVPTSVSMRMLSSAEHAAEARPGSVLMTMMFCASA